MMSVPPTLLDGETLEGGTFNPLQFQLEGSEIANLVGMHRLENPVVSAGPFHKYLA